MSQAQLTTKYRPQFFKEVVGQAQVRAVLSRAAEEDKVAAAYLFSGTRGVGKTTMARIFAKAVNCRTAPTGEPCNECDHCRQITAGACVDVVEIDAASNRGIDDARRLKEDIGYAPLDCRYKVFIIDEAHMLTKEAFNALLKTLEEPPGRVAFVLATTEAHKFPATIISRCQHFTFKRVGVPELRDHLARVLERENVGFEDEALTLVARRGQGSVRDAMSLLAQIMALGKDQITAHDVRLMLGLAGQEVFFEIMQAILDQDCPRLSSLLGGILDQGLDLGFFLRELAGCWRTMFLLRQSGEAALSVLELSEEDGRTWLDWAGRFDLAHIHACWQLTIEGQRRVLTSLEPAMALELLLFNLALMPRLVGVGEVGGGGGAPPTPSGGGKSAGGPGPRRDRNPSAQGSRAGRSSEPAASTASEPAQEPQQEPAPEPKAEQIADASPSQSDQSAPEPATPSRPAAGTPRTWNGFIDFVKNQEERTGRSINGLAGARGAVREGEVRVVCAGHTHKERMAEKQCHETLCELACEYFGPDTRVELEVDETRKRKTAGQLRKEVRSHPEVNAILGELEGKIIAVTPRNNR